MVDAIDASADRFSAAWSDGDISALPRRLGGRTCKDGLILPLGGQFEKELPDAFRACLYLLGLLWCFLGVAIISDTFMSAIERVTAKKVRTRCKHTGRYVTANVWNATVSNLTLMALGSSAPEILLSVIELLGNEFFSGELGPSTIVGSAAFNLLCITAVCVSCIPDGQVRMIKDMPVYIVTASFSLFAYAWLIIILQFRTENVVEWWEGLLTLLFFPALVGLAFIADKGFFSGAGGMKTAKHAVVAADMSIEELAAVELKIRQQYGGKISDEQMLKLIENEHTPKTRASYRADATKVLTGGKRQNSPSATQEDPLYNVLPLVGVGADPQEDLHKHLPCFEFVSSQFTVRENAGVVIVPVTRTGDTTTTSFATVGYKTRPGTALAVQDYVHVEGRLEFEPGEVTKNIEIKIVDDKAFETDEDFFIDLFKCEGFAAHLGPGSVCTITIIDDDSPGVLSFTTETWRVLEEPADATVSIAVARGMGGTGIVSCSYRTENDSALAGVDFAAADGTLSFENGQMLAVIPITVKAVGRYQRTDMFRVILENPTGGATFDELTDGGKSMCICSVFLESDKRQKQRLDRLMTGLKVSFDKTRVGHDNWRDQFVDALYVSGGDEDETPPSLIDILLHVVSVPWKLLFALVPPTDFCEGWACFVCALIAIGGTTAIIGDLASLLGCVMGIPDPITAITFVALGTSLPDTFASKTAAEQDPYADASVGNVTGSNSVNVFLGLGLPWLVGTLKWLGGGANAEWTSRYGSEPWVKDFAQNGGAVLVVEAGSLSFSVAVFTGCAVVCIALLFIRRKTVGGELGGPVKVKYATSCFLVFLWLVYISLSAWKVLSDIDD